jgi:Fe-S oxidoreductase
MSDLRKRLSETIEASDTIGCGCCSNYKSTDVQREAADLMNVSVSSVVLADELLEVINA